MSLPNYRSNDSRSPIIVADTSSACHRCSGELYLTATVPDPDLPCKRIIVLCPSCDAEKPAAQGLLAFMAIHGRVDESTFVQFEKLVVEWIAASNLQGVDEQTLDRDIEEWLRDRDW
ncbi:DUF6300 family protein [Solwaraspora sp. WMMB762]|uniref:DUF6300 family protein n=1 Tax=Solwaraspora sp. WMMB762 TaxID=3404120 RepID=UPI003B95D175